MVVLAVAFSSCTPPSGEAGEVAAVETVRAFFGALADNDDHALEAVAPEIARLAPGVLAQLAAGIAEAGLPEIGPSRIDGRRAVIPVAFVVPDAGGDSSDGETTTVLVPLKWRRGRWKIDKTLAVTQSFDVIRFSE